MNTIQTPLARVARFIPASSDRVFAAWIDPRQIGHFLFGPRVRDEEVLRLETDPIEGGHFSFVVRRNGRELNHTGRYLRVKPGVRLQFTWRVEEPGSSAPAPDSEVMLEFKAVPGGCELTLLHELHPDWADYVPKVEAGWALMVDALGRWLADAG